MMTVYTSKKEKIYTTKKRSVLFIYLRRFDQVSRQIIPFLIQMPVLLQSAPPVFQYMT